MFIAAKDLRIGDVIYVGKSGKTITVQRIERGESCGGIHLNVVRVEARPIKHKGKVVGLNPDRGRYLYSDGCWSTCALLEIHRPDVDATDALSNAATA
jgi:hypothetical protein